MTCTTFSASGAWRARPWEPRKRPAEGSRKRSMARAALRRVAGPGRSEKKTTAAAGRMDGVRNWENGRKMIIDRLGRRTMVATGKPKGQIWLMRCGLCGVRRLARAQENCRLHLKIGCGCRVSRIWTSQNSVGFPCGFPLKPKNIAKCVLSFWFSFQTASSKQDSPYCVNIDPYGSSFSKGTFFRSFFQGSQRKNHPFGVQILILAHTHFGCTVMLSLTHQPVEVSHCSEETR